MEQESHEIVYLTVSEEQLPFFQALASKTRLQILNLLRREDCSIKDMSEKLGVSSAIITKHIQMLEETGIVRSYSRPGKRGLRKLCTLSLNEAQIIFNNEVGRKKRPFTEIEIPISAYDQVLVTPPCGLASNEKYFGVLNDPRYFLAPNRYLISVLWFTSGYVEYPVPLMDVDLENLEELEFSFEIAPGPAMGSQGRSDIAFSLNGYSIGSWTMSRDMGGRRGRFTPSWWTSGPEYGLRKTILINEKGAFMDGMQVAETPLSVIKASPAPELLRFRISALGQGNEQSGLSLFGRSFGDFDQNILVRCYYRTDRRAAGEQNQ